MRKTHMIMATAMTLALAASASFADAKPTRHSAGSAKANAVTAQLNRQQLQGNGSMNAGGSMDANTSGTLGGNSGTGNSLSNSTGVDATGNINSNATTTDQSSVPAGSMSSTTNSAVAGDTSATSGTGTASDSSVPNSGQSMDQSTTNTQPRPSEDKGATGKNANPTDATDTPAQ